METMTTEELILRDGALRLRDVLDPWLRDVSIDDELPAMWHLAYLLPSWPHGMLGTDGHPVDGVPSPPGPGRRRMFASGTTVMSKSLKFGKPATRVSTVVDSVEKNGSQGELTFVTVENRIDQGGQRCITETQTIVYRDMDSSLREKTAVDQPPSGEFAQTFEVDGIRLFRFSAITQNAHRIHYDREYAAFEGYPDVVIHGPMQVLLMARALEQTAGSLLGKSFNYRLVAPAIGPQQLEIHAGSYPDAWAEVRSEAGRRTAVANVGAGP